MEPGSELVGLARMNDVVVEGGRDQGCGVVHAVLDPVQGGPTMQPCELLRYGRVSHVLGPTRSGGEGRKPQRIEDTHGWERDGEEMRITYVGTSPDGQESVSRQVFRRGAE